jgi:hypothetical protein
MLKEADSSQGEAERHGQMRPAMDRSLPWRRYREREIEGGSTCYCSRYWTNLLNKRWLTGQEKTKGNNVSSRWT